MLRASGADVVISYDSTSSRWRLYSAALQEGHAESETTAAAATTMSLTQTFSLGILVTGTANVSSLGARINQIRILRAQDGFTLVPGATIVTPNGSNMLAPGRRRGGGQVQCFRVYTVIGFMDPAALSFGARIDVLEDDVAVLQGVVSNLQVPTFSADADGAAEVLDTVDGRTIQRIEGDGELTWPANEEVLLLYRDADNDDRLTAVGGLDYPTPTAILSAEMSNLLVAGSLYPRVRGGWRIPYRFSGSVVHGGRVGNGTHSVRMKERCSTASSSGAGATSSARSIRCCVCRTSIPSGSSCPRRRSGGQAFGRPADLRGARVERHQRPPPLLLPSSSSPPPPYAAERRLLDGREAPHAGRMGDGDLRPADRRQVRRLDPADVRLRLRARGGYSVDDMGPGGSTNVFQNAVTAVRAVIREAKKLGYRVNVLGTLGDQGEADPSDPDLGNKQAQWTIDLNAAVKPSRDRPTTLPASPTRPAPPRRPLATRRRSSATSPTATSSRRRPATSSGSPPGGATSST